MILSCALLFTLNCRAEESSDAEARAAKVRPIKQTVDGRKLFDKSVTAAKINSEAASSGMVLTADGAGKATWNSLGAGGSIISNVVGDVTGNLTGNVTGNLTGNVTGNVSGTAANVTGIVAVANGGTGSSTQNFVDLTTNQTAAGNKTFTGTFNVSTCFTVESRPLSTGGLNNFIGMNAGLVNTTGLGNTFVGHNCGKANIGGSSNSFFGLNAGSSNTSGQLNTFIGQGAGAFNSSGSNNNAVGQAAGFNSFDGNANNYFGWHAGFGNASGSNNTCVGDQAGAANIVSNNTFVGSGAGMSNVSGTQLTFCGINAGNKTTASFNTFFGAGSGQFTSSGAGNTAIGNVSALNNTTGSNNAFLGGNTGASNTIESFNTFVGDSSNGSAGITNATAVGSKAIVTASNSLVLGSISGQNGAAADTFVGIGTSAPNSYLQVNGSISLGTRTTASVVSILSATDCVFVFTGSTAGSGANLPTAIGAKGRIYYVKNLGTVSFSLFTILNQTIDGVNCTSVALAIPITAGSNLVQLVSDGANWIRIN